MLKNPEYSKILKIIFLYMSRNNTYRENDINPHNDAYRLLPTDKLIRSRFNE